jgi:nucleotide-binding universal stress UspA family protein/GNAT superfamily N-acetyltransferase
MAAQIQTATKASARGDELVDVSRALGRWTETSRTASSDYLDLCEKTVGRFADLEVKSAQAIRLPLVATIAETHAAVSRQLAGAYVKAARDLSTPSRRRTITLRDGARVTLRPIAPEDKPLIAVTFERLSEESRYRRFFTTKNQLSAAELAYLVDVDHRDHEAIIAIDPSNGEALGVARYIRFKDDAEVAEVAVTVADDWQRRGLGRALLDRLTYHARREGVRRFSAFVQGDNPGALRLLADVGDTRQQRDSGVVELVIELPPKRGMGAQLARALRAVAAGSLVPAKTLARQVVVGVGSSPRPPVDAGRPIRTIVVGADGSETAGKALAVALWLAGVLGAGLHVVSAYGVLQAPSDAESVLEAATRAAAAEGLEAVTHARRDDPAEALIAVAEEQDADLLVVGSQGMSGAARFVLGSVPNRVSHHAPCSLLIVRTD